MTLAPGTSVGPYTVLASLGTGAMGEVYRARDERLGREVAIKCLPEKLVADTRALARFEREARVLAALSHPNILAIHDVGKIGKIPYAVTELLEGETLGAHLRGGPLPLERVLEYALQIAQGLAAAHDKGVFHRDLKPENVFVSAHGVKILDFGLAKADETVLSNGSTDQSRTTQPGMIVGTLAYMSPEQARGQTVDHRTDIFSFGTLLYKMLSGRQPFAGASAADTISAILHKDPADLRSQEIPAGVTRVLRHCLEKRPEARFQSCRDLAFALTQLRDAGEGATAVRTAVAGSLESRPSIAVLPFADMSHRKDQEYFCEGMAEEIINALTQIERLRVVARTSAFQFKDAMQDVRTIGEMLGVTSVLTGSVRTAGSRLRVTAQLVNTSDGYHLWSERFDRELEDVFAVQDEIARRVAETLSEKLVERKAGPLKPPPDLEVYTLYLKGRHEWNKRTEHSLKKAVAYFNQAIDLEPSYAQAHAGLAEALATLGVYGVLSPKEVMPRAKSAAMKALEILDSLPEAHASLGCVHSVYDWSWLQAEQDFQRAIALGPDSPTAHHWYAINCLVPRGRFLEAEGELKKALALDPLSLTINASLGLSFYFASDYQNALSWFLTTLEIDESFGMAHFFLGLTLAEMSRYTEAVQELQKAVRLAGETPEAKAALGYVAACSGDEERARSILGELEETSARRYVSPSLAAQVHIGLGDRAAALALLGKAYQERASDLAWLHVRPVFQRLRSEAEFNELIQGMGLTA